jgi:hypothetical protein
VIYKFILIPEILSKYLKSIDPSTLKPGLTDGKKERLEGLKELSFSLLL